MSQDQENKKPVSVYLEPDLLTWIDQEAVRDGRSRTRQITYFLEEIRRVREHNRRAQILNAGG